MKIKNIIGKSIKEQIRSYWVLLLSVSMGPFFIFVYYLIMETSKPQYNILIINNDKGVLAEGVKINFGDNLFTFYKDFNTNTVSTPFTVKKEIDITSGINSVKNKKADVLIIIDDSLSIAIEKRMQNDSLTIPIIEFIGDLTNTNYLIGAVWANEILNQYFQQVTGSKQIVTIKETALGSSGSVNDFDMVVPGILIVSIIMLMFTASIAFVSEVENKTIIRLKLSKLTTFEFLGGVTIVQLLVGVFSVLLTLITAIGLGFKYNGSVLIMILVASLTSLSIISFSLIIAAITKSANQVLVVGNFPMFLFMFFTGAAFPLKSKALFTIAGYPLNIQGLMSPTHAISALNKTLIMDMDFSSIIPEIVVIIILTIVYFIIGGLIYKRNHLKLDI
ncbi:MAG: ABC transporter permease [Bacteroidales bacterium]|nr:ABC transporter permease [Bacteroidales bacterium]